MATSSDLVKDILAGNALDVTDGTDGLTESNVDALASLSGLRSGLKSTQTVAEGLAKASRITAEGADAEIAAYTTAGDISEENARIAGIAGDISLLQQQREVSKATGQAQAAAAAGGVIGSSVYDVLRSSYQQGALGAQLIGVQTALEVGGYNEQAAATDAQIAAARTQSAAALAEADAYDAQATLAASQITDLQVLYADEDVEPELGPWRRDPLTGKATREPAPGLRSTFAAVNPSGQASTGNLFQQRTRT